MENALKEERIIDSKHNQPPSDQEILGEKLKEKYPEMFAFAERLLAAEERLPEEVNDDEASGKMGDFVKQVHTAYKNLDNARSSEKEFYLEGGRKIDGFFKTKYLTALETLKKKAEARNAIYLEKKKDLERRKREEEAERLRLAAEEKIREEQRLRREAEEKRREAEEATRKAQEEAAHREREIREAAEKERAAKQAEIDAMKKQRDEAERISKEERELLGTAEEELKEAARREKEALKKVRAETAVIEDAAHDLMKSAKMDDRAANKVLDEANRTDKQAEKMEKLADASAADLARTRGVEGSLSTIKTGWVITVTDRNDLDVVQLLQHFKDEDLQIAANSWCKANPGQQLRGCYVREETRAVTR